MAAASLVALLALFGQHAFVLPSLVAAGIAFGVSLGAYIKLRESEFNKTLRIYLDGRDEAFRQGFLPGRRWLAELIAEAEHARDRRDSWLAHKSHPARKAAAIVKESRTRSGN